MATKIQVMQFDLDVVEAQAELITPGRYQGKVEGAKLVDMPDGTERLWIGVRLDNNRYVTTLCSLVAAAKSFYKTKALAVATQQHLGLAKPGIPVDPTLLIGAELVTDVTIWQPANGTAVNDIRTFITK